MVSTLIPIPFTPRKSSFFKKLWRGKKLFHKVPKPFRKGPMVSTGDGPQPWVDLLALGLGVGVLTNSDVQGPPLLLCHTAHFCHRVSQVRGEGPIDVRLQLKQKRRGVAVGRTSAWCEDTSPLQRWPGSCSPSHGGPGRPALILQLTAHPRKRPSSGYCPCTRSCSPPTPKVIISRLQMAELPASPKVTSLETAEAWDESRLPAPSACYLP